MLHILNGETTLEGVTQTGIAGTLVSWGDLLMEGPLTGSATAAQDWEARAQWLELHFGIDRAVYLGRMVESLAALQGAAEQDEVVLWFEEDLLCQVHLMFVLAWFAEQLSLPANLSLICPAEGRLGPLKPSQWKATAMPFRLRHRMRQREAGSPTPATTGILGSSQA